MVVLANILLGINQGLTWSSTVVMKIDLVGKKERGLAMGLNEFAGYFAVGLVTYFTAVIASEYGLRPYPFYLGIVIASAGLIISLLVVKDTRHHVQAEESHADVGHAANVFWETTLKDRNLSSTTQAGLINNLNDGMIWGLLPLLLISYSFESRDIGIIAAVYPTVWGIGQLFTGRLADIYSNKRILFWGMILQGIAICLFMSSTEYAYLITLCGILGLGTALVYPTFLVVIANNTQPIQRAESIGVFRLWRDLGYAIGALLSGLIADIFGLEWAFMAIGVLTLLSALIIQFRMKE